MKKRLLCAVLLLTIVLQAQQKQDSITTNELDEVVISDSRFKLKKANSGKTIIKITAEELKQNQGKTIAEIINSKSGIEINGSRSNAGQNLSYFIRGGNNRQILVLIDGVQVSDPSQIANDYDLRLIDLNQIESIEIIKGASSTLYGNNAATAVISITSKKANKKLMSVVFSTSIGSNQSSKDDKYNIADFTNAISINGSINKINYLTSFLHQYTEGLSAVENGTERDAFNRINVNAKIGYQVSNKFKVDFFANHTKIKADFDNVFPIADADFVSKSEQNRVGTSLKYKYNSKGSINLNTSYNSIFRNLVSNFPSKFIGESFTVDLYNKYKMKSNIFIITGLNYIKNQTNFNQQQKIDIIDPYINTVWISNFGLNINIGARLNNHSEYGSHLTYNLNPSFTYNFKGNYVKVLGSFSTSYIAPSLAQLFGNFGANPNLKPEENTTLEAGFEVNLKNKIKFNAVFFKRTEEQFIDYVILDFITFQGEYQNTNQDIEVNGVEFEVSTEPIKNLNLNANYTFIEKKDMISLRIPKHKINATIHYKLDKKSSISLNYQYTDDRFDTNFTSFQNETLKSFSLVDFNFSREIIKNRLNVNLLLANIFNEDYTEVIGFTTKGRNFRIGLNIIF